MPNGLIALLILNIMTIPWRMRVQGCETATPIFGYALLGHLQQRQTRKSFETCVFACQSGSDCFSVNYYYGTTRCDLNNATNKQFPRDFVHHKSSIYIEDVSKEALYCKSLQCANGGTCLAQPTQPRESCVCLSSFTGVSCEGRYRQRYRFTSFYLSSMYASFHYRCSFDKPIYYHQIFAFCTKVVL